jgi:hypothetical protein
MREPRPKQRFPTNGKELYELLRLDHEPILMWVHLADEFDVHPDPNTLVYERFMDPMLYFWPVERQHVVVQLVAEPEAAAKKRLVDALLRDGAQWVTVLWLAAPGPDPDESRLRLENFGDADGFIRNRFGTLDPVAISGRGSGPD